MKNSGIGGLIKYWPSFSDSIDRVIGLALRTKGFSMGFERHQNQMSWYISVVSDTLLLLRLEKKLGRNIRNRVFPSYQHVLVPETGDCR